MIIKVNKGYDLDIEGAPLKDITDIAVGELLRLHPSDFPGVKPKMLVKNGDRLKKGQPVYFDKANKDIVFTAPISSVVEEIKLGERRVVDYIALRPEGSSEIESIQHTLEEILTLTNESIVNTLCSSGLWPMIRKRPFSKIPKPGEMPKAIFISAMSTAPFAVDLDVLLDQVSIKDIQSGLNVLSKLTVGDVNFVVPGYKTNSKIDNLKGVVVHTYSGPHPAGNVGVHISTINPIKDKNDSVWYLSFQDLIQIGQYFLNGKNDCKKIITVAGSAVEKKQHFRITRGTLVSTILKNNKINESSRLISGDILSGSISNEERSLNFYDESLTIINNSKKREFLGWIAPGFNKYSLSNTFFSKLMPKKNWILNTAKNGSLRAIVPIGAIEKVVPLDVMPTLLLKAIISRDIENMEELGIYECSPEDFSLCSFVDPSKMEISQIIQEGLNFAEEEG